MLEAFVAVGDELHFGRAARRLHLAQPPVSQRIRNLEISLGTQLFIRTTRSVSLTDAGEALLGPARQILRDLEEAELLARAAGTGTVGRIRIGFAGPSSHRDLPRLAQAVRRTYPEIELVLVGQTYGDEAVEGVASGNLDLGFARLPIDRPGLEHRVIGREELLCALPVGHRLAKERTVSLADLAEDPFVTFPERRGSTVRAATLRACSAAGFRPLIVQEAPDSHTILALVAAEVGVTLTLSSVRHVHQVGVSYRPLTGNIPALSPVLVWRHDQQSAALRRVLEVADRALPSRDANGH
jgi:DNA-binding transcriptional LysR family regulator